MAIEQIPGNIPDMGGPLCVQPAGADDDPFRRDPPGTRQELGIGGIAVTSDAPDSPETACSNVVHDNEQPAPVEPQT